MRMIRLTWISALSVLTACVYAQSGSDVAKAMTAKLRSAKSISGQMQITFPGGQPQSWKFKFLKPNLYQVIAPDQEFRSDGKTESTYYPGNKDIPGSKMYTMTAIQSGDPLEAPFTLGLNLFFATSPDLSVQGEAKPADLSGKKVVSLQVSQPGFSKPITLYVDPNSNLPLGYDQLDQTNGKIMARFNGLKLDDSQKVEDYGWSPPTDAKPLDTGNPENKLLDLQSAAPTPSASDASGAPVNLADEFKSHKATLVYFWNGVPPLPDEAALTTLFEQLKAQKFQVIAVFFKADKERGKLIAAESKSPFPVVVDDGASSIAKAYKVTSLSGYIIDATGRIVARFVPYAPDTVTRSLRQLGFSL